MKNYKLTIIALAAGLLCNQYAFSMKQDIATFASKEANNEHITTQDVLNAANAVETNFEYKKYIHNNLLKKIEQKITSAKNSILTYLRFLKQPGYQQKQIIQAINKYKKELDELKNAKTRLENTIKKVKAPKKEYKETIEKNPLERLKGQLKRREGTFKWLKDNSSSTVHVEKEIKDIKEKIKKLKRIKIEPKKTIKENTPKLYPKPVFTNIYKSVKIPPNYNFKPNKSTDGWYTITPKETPKKEIFIKKPKEAKFHRDYVKSWTVPIFSRDQRFEMIHFGKLTIKYWQRDDLKKSPDTKKEIIEFGKEIMEGQAYKYKIHLQIKPEYLGEVVTRLAQLIANNKDIFPEVYFKVAGQIKPGENYYYPNGKTPKAALPMLPIYTPYLPSSMTKKEKEKILIKMIDAIKNEFKDIENKIELKIPPRYNKKIYKYIYVSGGEGRDKEIYIEWLKKNKQKNKIYSDDFAFYKGYELFEKPKKEIKPKGKTEKDFLAKVKKLKLILPNAFKNIIEASRPFLSKVFNRKGLEKLMEYIILLQEIDPTEILIKQLDEDLRNIEGIYEYSVLLDIKNSHKMQRLLLPGYAIGFFKKMTSSLSDKTILNQLKKEYINKKIKEAKEAKKIKEKKEAKDDAKEREEYTKEQFFL